MTDRQKYQELYWCWKAIKQRCLNPRCRAYHNYGGRGITVCDEWMEFEPFLAWALDAGWEKGLDLDRIDNDGGYKPSNCRFVTRRENANNRRKTKLITVDGVTRPSTVWADMIGASHGVVKAWRIKHGTDYAAGRIKDALENGYTPKDYGFSHRVPIRHVESGRIFESMSAAARYFGVEKFVITNAMNKRGITPFGHFVREEIG